MIFIDGSPRSGKTVLANQLVRATAGQGLLIDALSPMGTNTLKAPASALGILGPHGATTLIVDNADSIENLPEVLSEWKAAPKGQKPRLVLFGTSFPETPALARLELPTLSIREAGNEGKARHWLRGGYPEALFAHSDQAAFGWLATYAEAVSEARLARAGLPWAPGRSRRLLSMLAHFQGESLNENAIARSLGVSRPTVTRSVTALEQLGLLSKLPSLPSPAGKRARRGSAYYLRDSGLCHSLLGLESTETLMGSPRLATSWEGYVIEQARILLPRGYELARYRTQDGAGLELVIVKDHIPVLGASIRWAGFGAAPSKGALVAKTDLRLEGILLVVPESEDREAGKGVRITGLSRFLEIIAGLER